MLTQPVEGSKSKFEPSGRTRRRMLPSWCAVGLRRELQQCVVSLWVASIVCCSGFESKSRESRASLAASEEDGEAGERSSPQSPALLALCQSPSSGPELHPVCVNPVRGVQSIRVSPLLLGENAGDFGWPRETQNRCPARGRPCVVVALSWFLSGRA